MAMPTRQSTTLLRILATSDVHMHLKAHDYFSDAPLTHCSLEALAGRIATLRQDAHAQGGVCLLIDNGDLLQGTPLADHLAQTLAPDTAHPVAETLHALGYDALGLGNHDLDYGLDYLARFARDLPIPVMSSNLHPDQPADWLHDGVLLDRGGLRIGLLSVLPKATETWAHAHLKGRARISDMVMASRDAAARLRAEGADIVIGLAHTGFGDSPDENALAQIAQTGALDALIGGHTHRLWPEGPDAPQQVHGVPTVMPGYAGEAVGCIDLYLHRDDTARIGIRDCRVRLERPMEAAAPPEGVFCPLDKAHQRTRADLNAVLGHTDRPLSSYMARVAPTPMLALTAAAMMDALADAAKGTAFGTLPVLAAVSPARAGGAGGPLNYADIPSGPLRRRQVAELHIYPNAIWGVPVTGAEVRAWLEKSAMAFNPPERIDTLGLLNPVVPAFDFDVIYGLTFEIDILSGDGRIGALHYQGRPVAEDDRFVVATTSYRACGGGQFPGLHPDREMLCTDLTAAQVMQAFVASGARPDLPVPWRFAPNASGRKTWFDTGPGGREYLHEIGHLAPEIEGLTPNGFLRIAVTL